MSDHSGSLCTRLTWQIHYNGVKKLDMWFTFVTDVGFPSAVTFYLLHRVEGKLDLMIETLHLLPEKMVSSK